MGSLYIINSQITSLQSSIYTLNQELQQSKDDLLRLQMSLSNLLNCQSNFKQNTKLCTSPEFSQSTWYGQLSSHYDSFREGELLPSYQELSNVQLNQRVTKINDKIRSIQEMIDILEERISFERSRLNHLFEMRRKEILN